MHTQPELFTDSPVLANTIRVFVITAGITLAAVATKIGVVEWWRARRAGEPQLPDVSGALGFALVVATTPIGNLFRLDAPLLLYTTITYVLGLTLCIVSTAHRVTLRREERRAGRH